MPTLSPLPGELRYKVHMPDPPLRFDTKDRFEINLPSTPATLAEFAAGLDGCSYPIVWTLVDRALAVSFVLQELPSETRVPLELFFEFFDPSAGLNDMLSWGVNYRSRKTGRRDDRLVTRYRGSIQVQADAWNGSNSSIIPAAVLGRLSYDLYDNSPLATLALAPVVGWAAGSSPVIPVRKLIPDEGPISERETALIPLALYDIGDTIQTIAEAFAAGRPIPELNNILQSSIGTSRLRERFVTRVSIIGESGQVSAPSLVVANGMPPTGDGITFCRDGIGPTSQVLRIDPGCHMTLTTTHDVPPSLNQGMISVISSPTGGVTVGVPTSSGVSWKKAYSSGHQLVESPELFPGTGLKQY